VLEGTQLVVLAEEVGLVRREQVARIVPLLRAALCAVLEQLVVVGERREAADREALAEAALERRARLRTEPDPESLADEIAQ
jgi:hypothetical protein